MEALLEINAAGLMPASFSSRSGRPCLRLDVICRAAACSHFRYRGETTAAVARLRPSSTNSMPGKRENKLTSAMAGKRENVVRRSYPKRTPRLTVRIRARREWQPTGLMQGSSCATGKSQAVITIAVPGATYSTTANPVEQNADRSCRTGGQRGNNPKHATAAHASHSRELYLRCMASRIQSVSKPAAGEVGHRN